MVLVEGLDEGKFQFGFAVGPVGHFDFAVLRSVTYLGVILIWREEW